MGTVGLVAACNLRRLREGECKHQASLGRRAAHHQPKDINKTLFQILKRIEEEELRMQLSSGAYSMCEAIGSVWSNTHTQMG